MAIATAQITISDLTDITYGSVFPSNPVDGTLFRLTTNNSLYVADSAKYVTNQKAPSPWVAVVDSVNIMTLIAALQNGTISNEAFNQLMSAASTLSAFADADGDDQALWKNLAASLNFDENGLSISNKGGDIWTRLALTELQFYKGKDAAAALMAVFGVLRTITSPTLQVGSSASQSPKVVIGGGMLEYQAATGNLTCRKA